MIDSLVAIDNVPMIPTITDWILAVCTIILAIVAIFQDIIRAWIMRPKLRVKIKIEPPDCMKELIHYNKPDGSVAIADCYYFRIRVHNYGNQKAELAEVFFSKLLRCQADGNYKDVEYFKPMNLTWTHYQNQIFFPSISPETYKHCDVFRIIDPKKRLEFGSEVGEDKTWPNINRDRTVLSFILATRPHTLSHLAPFGKYRLVIIVAAANAKPITKTYEVNVTGDWYDDERQMLRDGIAITEIYNQSI